MCVVGRLAACHGDDGSCGRAQGDVVQRSQVLPRHWLGISEPVVIFRLALQHLELVPVLLLVHDLYGALLVLGVASKRTAEPKFGEPQIRRPLPGVDVVVFLAEALLELVDHAAWSEDVLATDDVPAWWPRRGVILVEI